MAFISCHLEAGNKFEERRAQYQELSYELGGKLGHGAGVDLGTQFHHVVWVGDLNYRCVQGAEPGHRDKSFPGDRAIALLEQVKTTLPSFLPSVLLGRRLHFLVLYVYFCAPAAENSNFSFIRVSHQQLSEYLVFFLPLRLWFLAGRRASIAPSLNSTTS